jgi:hypothetical protein
MVGNEQRTSEYYASMLITKLLVEWWLTVYLGLSTYACTHIQDDSQLNISTSGAYNCGHSLSEMSRKHTIGPILNSERATDI